MAVLGVLAAALGVVAAYDNGVGRLAPMGWNTWWVHAPPLATAAVDANRA
jgi:flavin reductase (DIM6/NTAB) family NADH-FMN oxidoreductase RutF